MNKISDIYKDLPSGVKNILKYSYSLIPLRLRLGKKFFKQLEFLEKSQWWSETELENYQNEELRKLIAHCYNNVPYYNKLFKESSLTPKDIRTIQDLPKIPILTKEIVRNNLNLLRADNFKDNELIKLSTSGTTGKYLLFYYDRNKEYLDFDPFIWRFFGWGKHKLGQRRATLSEWLPAKGIYEYNPVRNLLIMSIHNMKIKNSAEYAKIMQKYSIQYLYGYPSMIYLLTSYLKTNGINRPLKLEAIFSHSESLYRWQRKIIEDFWGCKCFDWYGLEERVVLGIECNKHNGLHLCSEYGITELTNGEPDGFKKIIATSLTNYAMPFIRYDTSDIGELSANKCICGRGFPILSLKGGRVRNFAVGKDSSYVPIDSLDIPSFTNNIWQFQFIQTNKGLLILKMVIKDTFDTSDTKHISAELNKKFNGNMDVELQIVRGIEQTANGKTPLFIQKMAVINQHGISG